MSYSLEVRREIPAPVSRVWAALTQPEYVRQYFFGSELVTDWAPGSPVYFRGSWEGNPYEDKGIVLHYEAEKTLSFSYHSSWSDLEDLPENYQKIEYSVEPSGAGTLLTIRQENIDTPEKKEHSENNWNGVIDELIKIL